MTCNCGSPSSSTSRASTPRPRTSPSMSGCCSAARACGSPAVPSSSSWASAVSRRTSPASCLARTGAARAVLERVDQVLLVGLVARRVHAVLGRHGIVVARGRRVGLVVVDLLVRVRAPSDRNWRNVHPRPARRRSAGRGRPRSPRAAARHQQDDHDRDDRDADHGARDLHRALARAAPAGGLLLRFALAASALLLLGSGGHRRDRIGNPFRRRAVADRPVSRARRSAASTRRRSRRSRSSAGRG